MAATLTPTTAIKPNITAREPARYNAPVEVIFPLDLNYNLLYYHTIAM